MTALLPRLVRRVQRSRYTFQAAETPRVRMMEWRDYRGMTSAAHLHRCRWAIGIFIVGLVLSGVTAFPLATEMEWLVQLVSPGGPFHAVTPEGLRHWLLTVRDGLKTTYALYPWVGYGTDWLAFGHLIIALFFLPAWREPVRYAAILRIGLVACALVIPLAFIAGPVRGIPLYWRLIDCSFGVVGAMPLWFALRGVARMEEAAKNPAPL